MCGIKNLNIDKRACRLFVVKVKLKQRLKQIEMLTINSNYRIYHQGTYNPSLNSTSGILAVVVIAIIL